MDTTYIDFLNVVSTIRFEEYTYLEEFRGITYLEEFLF